MPDDELSVVTGAFGYTGRYIATRLLAAGKQVRTLTGHPHRPNPFGDAVSVAMYDFGNRHRLVESLRGASTLYNTYWVRFTHRSTTFTRAVENNLALIRAASEAGVRRIVHVSITNPSLDSPLPYFRGKAEVEQAVIASGISYAILRPTVIFGREDILINDIAWLLRQLPAFGVFGDGKYRLQPVYVEDFADLAVSAGQRHDDIVWDAVGPEIFTFDELVHAIREAIGSRAKVVHVSPRVGLCIGKIIGLFVGDVVITTEEIEGLMTGLLVSDQPPTCRTALTEWLSRHCDTVGMSYASELNRHYQ